MFVMEKLMLAFAMLQNRRDDNEKGAAMVEYAILVAGIAVIVGAAVYLLGGQISTMFGNVTTKLSTGF